MIGIKKSAVIPAVLSGRGQRARDRLCAKVARGDSKLSFDQRLYGHASVKQRLIADQHGKCCFCESKVGEDGDVEHFRPKAGWRQGADEPLNQPGYYWLAYEWHNLLLCCSACNQRFKRNFFPLLDPNKRVKTPDADLTLEEPLFINPAERDPADFIGFRKEIAYPIDDKPAGKATIEALGLNRAIFNERRRDRLATLITLQKAIVALRAKGHLTTDDREIIDSAQMILDQAAADSAEFAAMARAAQQSGFRVGLP